MQHGNQQTFKILKILRFERKKKKDEIRKNAADNSSKNQAQPAAARNE